MALRIPEYSIEARKAHDEISEVHGPGVIGITSATMSRYVEFHISKDRVIRPPGSVYTYEYSVGIAQNFNNMCETTLKDTKWEWLWILGDDHTFDDGLLMRLLDRRVDIVVPLCLRRNAPYWPVINGSMEDGHPALDDTAIQGKTGLMEVDACGNAGMLIRRHVLARMGGDWHRAGCQKSGAGGPDLWFCMKAREAGFKILVDLDNPILHIMHMAVVAVRDKDGNYRAKIAPPLDMP